MYFLIAENVAKQWKISRQNQDEFALSSQNQAEKAQKDGHFNDELISIPVKIRKGKYSIITLYQLNRSPGQKGMKAEVMMAFLSLLFIDVYLHGCWNDGKEGGKVMQRGG